MSRRALLKVPFEAVVGFFSSSLHPFSSSLAGLLEDADAEWHERCLVHLGVEQAMVHYWARYSVDYMSNCVFYLFCSSDSDTHLPLCADGVRAMELTVQQLNICLSGSHAEMAILAPPLSIDLQVVGAVTRPSLKTNQGRVISRE